MRVWVFFIFLIFSLVGCANEDNSLTATNTETAIDDNLVEKEEKIILEAYDSFKSGNYSDILLKLEKNFISDYKNDAELINLFTEYRIEKERLDISEHASSDVLKKFHLNSYVKLQALVAKHLAKISPDPEIGMEQFDYRDNRLKFIEELKQIDFSLDTWEKLYNNPSLAEEYVGRSNAIGNPPTLGMTAQEVILSTWGQPYDINKTTSQSGVSEQWVYSDYKYIYLEDGIVTSIQE